MSSKVRKVYHTNQSGSLENFNDNIARHEINLWLYTEIVRRIKSGTFK